uniref:Uncharacterized protein n=1 Tax=Parascaris equorum TaxID=6256 RepID=A0A914S0H3_PAREQ
MRIIHSETTCVYCGSTDTSREHREATHWRRLAEPRSLTLPIQQLQPDHEEPTLKRFVGTGLCNETQKGLLSVKSRVNRYVDPLPKIAVMEVIVFGGARNMDTAQKFHRQLVVLLKDRSVNNGEPIKVHKGFPPGLIDAFPGLADLEIRVTDFAVDESMKSIVLSFPVETKAADDPRVANFIRTPVYIDLK